MLSAEENTPAFQKASEITPAPIDPPKVGKARVTEIIRGTNDIGYEEVVSSDEEIDWFIDEQIEADVEPVKKKRKKAGKEPIKIKRRLIPIHLRCSKPATSAKEAPSLRKASNNDL